MGAQFYEAGKKFDYTATADIGYHEVVAVGALVGITCHSAKQGETVSCDAVGVFKIDKAAGEEITQGAAVYLNAENKITAQGTATAAETEDDTGAAANSNVKAGIAWAAAAASDAYVLVAINK